MTALTPPRGVDLRRARRRRRDARAAAAARRGHRRGRRLRRAGWPARRALNRIALRGVAARARPAPARHGPRRSAPRRCGGSAARARRSCRSSLEALRAVGRRRYYGDAGVMRGARLRRRRARAGAPRRERRDRAGSPTPRHRRRIVDGVAHHRRAGRARGRVRDRVGRRRAPVVAKELAEARHARRACSRRASTSPPTRFTARPRDMLARLYRDAGQHATLGTPADPAAARARRSAARRS